MVLIFKIVYGAKLRICIHNFLFIFIMIPINKYYALHHSSTSDLLESGPKAKYHQSFGGAFYDAACSFHSVKKPSGSI
jgi:hypothetical protein